MDPADEIRTKFIDFDARPKPKTGHWCVRCQKDLKPGAAHRIVHVIDDVFSVHPDGAQPPSDQVKIFPMGMDCARLHGMEWTREPPAAGLLDISKNGCGA